MQPSVRIYFDLGTDDPGELDIYNDGTLVPTINLVELYVPYYLTYFLPDTSQELYVAPTFGFGITAPADDSADGTDTASDAPVLILTTGVLAALKMTEELSLGLEAGFALGLSTDEGLTDISDSAIYVGLVLDYDF